MCLASRQIKKDHVLNSEGKKIRYIPAWWNLLVSLCIDFAASR